MITDSYRKRRDAGIVEDGRVTGTVRAYHSFEGEVVSAEILVTKTDLPGLDVFRSALVSMPVPRDTNYLLRDVVKGDPYAGYDAVPIGGEVTFVECSLVTDRQVEAHGYELPGMNAAAYAAETDEASASPGP